MICEHLYGGRVESMKPRRRSRDGQPPEGEMIERRRLMLRWTLKETADMVLFSRVRLRVLETGRASEGRRPVPQAASYARVARALGMTAEEWYDAAKASRYTSAQRDRLRAIAKEIENRTPAKLPTDIDVDQIAAMLMFIRSLCTNEVFVAALRRCDSTLTL